MSDVTGLSPAVPKPVHVPDSLVYDFDMYRDPAYLANPHDRILDLIRNAPPIFWTPRYGGHWMLIGHEANFNASRDTETFSSEFVPKEQLKAMQERMPPGTPHIPNAVPIGMNPPDHGRYRAPLQRVFSPKAILAIKEQIRALANELIDKVRAQGHCDFMIDIAEPLPVITFLRMMGLPVERMAEFRVLVREQMADQEPDPKQAVLRLIRTAAAMRETFLERRENPRDDIISLLWKTQIDGQPMTMDLMEDFGVLLFSAGLDTVMNGMGFGVRHLAMHPELQSELRANPKLIAEAGEELLRRYTFTIPPRVVGKDAVFQGVKIKKGERAMLFLPAADLDPKEFANADSFDLKRENKVHIAFNAGPHRCVGSHLARIELQVLYEQLMERLPEFRLDPKHPPRFHGGHVIGVDSLHLLWNTH